MKKALDDLKNEASRFVSIYGKKNQQLVNRGITPLNAGTNLHIKVTVRSDNYKIDGLATECTTNSLFADQSTSNQAVVYYGRHLQNLDLASGVTEGITESRRIKKKGTPVPGTVVMGIRHLLPLQTLILRNFPEKELQ